MVFLAPSAFAVVAGDAEFASSADVLAVGASPLDCAVSAESSGAAWGFDAGAGDVVGVVACVGGDGGEVAGLGFEVG